MAQQEDLQSAIDNVHKSLVQRSKGIIGALAQSSPVSKDAVGWVEYANQLQRLVPNYAIPTWVSDACRIFGLYFQNNLNNCGEIAHFVTTRMPEIVQPIMVGEAATLDLEQLFQEQSERFRLNQVFDDLISRLSDLIAADVIDNRLVDDSLQRLNALFRRTRNGSLATVLLTMNFGRFFIKSFSSSLKQNRYAKPFIENFEEEFATASKIVEKAKEETQKVMISKLINSSRMELFIESHPDLEDTIVEFLPAPRDDGEAVEGDEPQDPDGPEED